MKKEDQLCSVLDFPLKLDNLLEYFQIFYIISYLVKIRIKPRMLPAQIVRPIWPLLAGRRVVSRIIGTNRPKPDTNDTMASSLKDPLLKMVVLNNGAWI